MQDPAALVDLKKQRVRVDLDLPGNAMSLRLKAVCEGSHAESSRTARSSKESKREGHNEKGLGGGDARGVGSGHEGGRSVEGSTRGRNGGARNCGKDNEADVPRVRDSVRSRSLRAAFWMVVAKRSLCRNVYERVGFGWEGAVLVQRGSKVIARLKQEKSVLHKNY